jgi:hypothetical protein
MRKAAAQQYGTADLGEAPLPAPPTLCDALKAYNDTIKDGAPDSASHLSEIADCVISRMTTWGLKYTARELMTALDTCNPETKADEYAVRAFREAADKYVNVEGEPWNDNPKFRVRL